MPPSIKTIIEGNPQVFKAELDPNNHIWLEQIPDFAAYKKGIKLDVKPGSTPVANYSTRPVPLHYVNLAHKLYQDLIDQKVVRKVLPNETCNWVSPLCIVVKPSSSPANPQL